MSSKGVTPVIAVVLLITISIAATGTAYTFIINAQQGAQESYEERFNQRQIEQRTDLNIEHVYNNSDGDALMIVRNTGSLSQIIEEDDKFWTVYADGSPIGTDGKNWEYVQNTYNSQSDVRLNPQDTIPINTTTPFPNSGEKRFRIVGRYGSEDTMICSANPQGTC